MMKCLTGKCVSNQIVIAPLLFAKKAAVVSHLMEETADDACEKIVIAREKAVSFCRELIKQAESENNPEAKAIFEAQELLLTDENLEACIYKKIREEKLNAVMAVVAAGEEVKEVFSSLGDEVVSARTADVEDVVSYYLQALGAYESISLTGTESGVIVMATELTPADTMQLPKEYVAGFVTQAGSAVSHASILAGSLGIPALYGVEVSEEYAGCLAILDGEKNCLIVNPDGETLDLYREKLEGSVAMGGNTIKGDYGKVGKLYANVASVDDAREAFANGAQGIGLYRSECLFLGRDRMPSEDEQFMAYKELLEVAEGREVVIRILDVGSDKKCTYFSMEKEKNPALGLRGIRYLFANPEILKTQLRALQRAAEYGNLSILFPMISTMEEVKEIKAFCKEFQDDIQIGIMIETPAAALITEQIAAECDFVSIGTNDLLQYLMAVDRESILADSYLKGNHPAVIKILKQIVEEAHSVNCKVCICGELAADEKMETHFKEWKVDVLSVSWNK